MPWRIAGVLSPKADPIYEVAMSFSYLMNCVATLAIAGTANIPEELKPATTILDELELVPTEICTIYEEVNLGDKPFLQVRRVHELTHRLKSSEPLAVEPQKGEGDVELATEEET
jgi:hypothetical protein